MKIACAPFGEVGRQQRANDERLEEMRGDIGARIAEIEERKTEALRFIHAA